jgi:hypothetical protein
MISLCTKRTGYYCIVNNLIGSGRQWSLSSSLMVVRNCYKDYLTCHGCEGYDLGLKPFILDREKHNFLYLSCKKGTAEQTRSTVIRLIPGLLERKFTNQKK